MFITVSKRKENSCAISQSGKKIETSCWLSGFLEFVFYLRNTQCVKNNLNCLIKEFKKRTHIKNKGKNLLRDKNALKIIFCLG